MYKIVDDVIHITRGDSAYIAINVTDIDGNPFYLDDSIEVRAQVRSVLNDDENKGLRCLRERRWLGYLAY